MRLTRPPQSPISRPPKRGAKQLYDDLQKGIAAARKVSKKFTNDPDAALVVAAWVDGYLRGKGWDVDMTDAILAALVGRDV